MSTGPALCLDVVFRVNNSVLTAVFVCHLAVGVLSKQTLVENARAIAFWRGVKLLLYLTRVHSEPAHRTHLTELGLIVSHFPPLLLNCFRSLQETLSLLRLLRFGRGSTLRD